MALVTQRPLDPIRAAQANAAIGAIVIPQHAKPASRDRQHTWQRKEFKVGGDAVPLAAADLKGKANLLTLTLIPAHPPPGNGIPRPRRRWCGDGFNTGCRRLPYLFAW